MSDNKDVRFISDLIKNSKSDNEESMFDIWKKSDRNLLIKADTGAGKTYFVMNSLAKEENSKILYICNRAVLKNQIEKDISDKGIENISVRTYQEISKILVRYMNKFNIDSLDCENTVNDTTENTEEAVSEFEINMLNELIQQIESSTYLVLDEIHYFTSDYRFNDSLSKCFDFLFNTFKSKQKILLSATPELFLKLDEIEEIDLNIYDEWIPNVERNYDNYNFFGFSSLEAVSNLLIGKLIKGEKCLVFVNSEKQYKNIFKKMIEYIENEYQNYKGLIDMLNDNNIDISKMYSENEKRKKIEKVIEDFLKSKSCFIDRKGIQQYFEDRRNFLLSDDEFSWMCVEIERQSSDGCENGDYEITDFDIEKQGRQRDKYEQNLRKSKETYKVYQEICENSTFSPMILFSTKILDNGINVRYAEGESTPIKNIIIFDKDIVTIRQEIGRVRVNESQEVNIYLHKNKYYDDELKKVTSILKLYEDFRDGTMELNLNKLKSPYFYIKKEEEKYTINIDKYVESVLNVEKKYLEELIKDTKKKQLVQYIATKYYGKESSEIEIINKESKQVKNNKKKKDKLKKIIYTEQEKEKITKVLDELVSECSEKGDINYKYNDSKFKKTLRPLLKIDSQSDVSFSIDNVKCLFELQNIPYVLEIVTRGNNNQKLIVKKK